MVNFYLYAIDTSELLWKIIFYKIYVYTYIHKNKKLCNGNKKICIKHQTNYYAL